MFPEFLMTVMLWFYLVQSKPWACFVCFHFLVSCSSADTCARMNSFGKKWGLELLGSHVSDNVCFLNFRLLQAKSNHEVCHLPSSACLSVMVYFNLKCWFYRSLILWYLTTFLLFLYLETKGFLFSIWRIRASIFTVRIVAIY